MMLIRLDFYSPAGIRLALRLCLTLLVLIISEQASQRVLGEGDVNVDESYSSGESGLDAFDVSTGTHEQPRFTNPDRDEVPQQPRLREGTVLSNVVGRFKVSGDRATFIVNDSQQSFGGLENLNMARILNIIRDDPDADWSISGTVTEFQGSNYVLITKAIRKTRESEQHLKRAADKKAEQEIADGLNAVPANTAF